MNYPPITFTEETIQKLFGHEAAEDENIERLKEYYLKNDIYKKVAANMSLRILVGYKGVGKSALFTVLMAEDRENDRIPILIKPDDLTNIGQDTDNFLQLIRNWKNGLQEIITNKIFNSFGIAKGGVIGRIHNYSGKLFQYLSESINAVKNNVDLKPTEKAFVNSFLKSNKIVIYIDDLDRGWQSKKQDIFRISALLNAVRDLSTESRGLNFKISLRSDVYYLVRTADESTDKIEGSVIWYTWTNHEILLLLVKRIETYFGRPFYIKSFENQRQQQLSLYLDPIFNRRFHGLGRWSDVPVYQVLMSMIRNRPRDLVKLCTLAGRSAYDAKKNMIGTENLRSIFEEYSQGRVQDTVNEYKSELSNIEKLLLEMKPSKKTRLTSDGYIYSTPELIAKISNIKQHANFRFASGKEASAKELAQFLYKINFITARKDIGGQIQRKYFEQNRLLSSDLTDFGYDWEIHPAFRWALQPEDINDIFYKLQLTADA